MHLKMLSAKSIHLLALLKYVSIEANSVDPDQIDPIESGSSLFVGEAF